MTTIATDAGGFAATDLTRLLDRACMAAALDPANARLMRGHTNAVFVTDGVVVKIARNGTQASTVQRTVDLVTWLTARGFPTVPLHPVQQPVDLDGHYATYWTYLPQPARPVSAEQLAKPLRTLHQLDDPPVPLPAADTAAAIRRSIASTTALTNDEIARLTDRLDHLQRELEDVSYELAPSVIQSDPQHRNALHTTRGNAVLCDWDTASFGPPELDLVTVEIHCRRFGYGQAHYEAFANSYGYDIRTWAGYPALAGLRELRMITTNAKRATPGSATIAEVRRRINGMHCDDPSQLWTIL
ncbi:aminoglycoside phosphotransferase family protein [Kitasatospora sp. NPDC001603]|uniref:phosphotransferase family protein n=1 Tax=Kitasatospora sp. NPDC001603 TaxID=3154388 RepID=UPI00331941EF